MEITERVIQEFITREGINPFREWFDSIKDIWTQVKVDVRLARIRLGNAVKYFNIKHIIFKS